MKIIDKVADYYDFSGLGIDPTIIFYRSSQSSKTVEGKWPIPEFAGSAFWRFESNTDFSYQPSLALVGGYGFPFVTRTQRYNVGPDDESHIYGWERFEKQLKKDTASMTRYSTKNLREKISGYEAFLSHSPHDIQDLCVSERFVTGIIVQERHSLSYRPDLLTSVKLQDELGAHEAHMLVSRFVGGVLPVTQPTEELSDRSKILKAGFDLKTSFRKPSSS